VQFAAVEVDEPLLFLRERSIEIHSGKKMLACTREVMNFLLNPQGLPIQVTWHTAGFCLIVDEDGRAYIDSPC
jgi:hypothetical protein